jgi:hypothetical protein
MSEERFLLGAKLSLALSITTLSIPALYLIGYGYYQGYLGAFGVSTDFFPQSVQDYLTSAFFAFSLIIIKIWNVATEKYWIFLIIAACMTVFSALMVWVMGEKQQIAIQERTEQIKSHPLSLYFFLPIGLGIFTLVMPYLLIAALSFVVLLPYVAFFIGNDEGKSAIEVFQECQFGERPERRNCVYVYQGDKILAKGFLIARSTHHISIFEGDRVIILPSANLRIVVITPEDQKVNKTIQPTPKSGAADD